MAHGWQSLTGLMMRDASCMPPTCFKHLVDVVLPLAPHEWPTGKANKGLTSVAKKAAMISAILCCLAFATMRKQEGTSCPYFQSHHRLVMR